jgi:hypothetical protein
LSCDREESEGFGLMMIVVVNLICIYRNCRGNRMIEGGREWENWFGALHGGKPWWWGSVMEAEYRHGLPWWWDDLNGVCRLGS